MIFQDVFSQYDVKNNKFECKWRLDKENVLGWLKTIDGFANDTVVLFFFVLKAKLISLFDMMLVISIRKKSIFIIN